MLSKSEWMHEADRAAAHAWGEEHRNLLVFRRWLAGPVGIVVTVLVIGLGLRWLWVKLDAGTGSFPAPAFWMVAGLLLLATAIAFRPRRIPTRAHLLVLKLAVFGLLWLGVVAYGVTVWI